MNPNDERAVWPAVRQAMFLSAFIGMALIIAGEVMKP